MLPLVEHWPSRSIRGPELAIWDDYLNISITSCAVLIIKATTDKAFNNCSISRKFL